MIRKRNQVVEQEQVETMTTLEKRFRVWHKDNPEVYDLFKRFTFEAINKGHDRLSAWLIVNRIRWETSVTTTGNEFKISNDFIAYYARMFIKEYPRYTGFFSLHEMKR